VATYFAKQKNWSARREDEEKDNRIRGRKEGSEITGFLLFDKSLMENPG